MYYQPGVGTEGNITDAIAGGAFGFRVSEVGELALSIWRQHRLTSCDRTLGRPIASLQRIMSLVMKLFSWGFLGALSRRVALRYASSSSSLKF